MGSERTTKITLDLTVEEIEALEEASYFCDLGEKQGRSPPMESLGEKIRQTISDAIKAADE